jgi:hypothetical protein
MMLYDQKIKSFQAKSKLCKAAYIVFVCLIAFFTLGVTPAENIAHKVVLTWNKPTGNYDGFNVYRKDCVGFILLKTLDKKFTMQDTAVVGGEVYSYYVTTLYQGSESLASATVTTTVPY